MRSLMVALLGLTVAASGGGAAEKPTAKQPGAKAAPACAALVFRPLPGGGTDGEQTAGTYKSRFARLELRGTVQNGTAVNYHLVTNGNGIVAAPQLPQAASDCASSKKMPRPGQPKYPCTGERFTAILAHAGEKRLALLYALNGGTWTFCNAGSF